MNFCSRVVVLSWAILLLSTSVHAVVPVHQWSQRFGDTVAEVVQDAVVDASGNVIITGLFIGTVDFGGGPFVVPGILGDIFVAKYDSTGAHLWSKQFGDTGPDQGNAVAVDASGNVIITGGFAGTVDFGGGNLVSAGIDDIFVAKYNSAGVHQWSQRFGGTSSELGTAVVVDASGNVIVVGLFAGTVDLGGGNLVSAGSLDIFIAKYNSAGVHQWSQRFGDTGQDVVQSVDVDASGNVVMAGTFNGTVDFGGGNLISAGFEDIFVAKYNSAGAHQWSQRYGDTLFDLAGAVAVDASGNVLLTGGFIGTVDFGGGNLVSAGNNDIFVAKYNSAGAHQWSQRFGDASGEVGWGITVDDSASVYVTGAFVGSVDLGGGTLNSAGSSDMFMAKYHSDGTYQWSKRFGSTGSDEGYAIPVDASENVIVTGKFSGTVDFGGGNLTSAGTDDIILAKYTVAQICDVQPTSITMGPVSPGNTADSTFVIKNTGAGIINGNVTETCGTFSILSGGGPFSLANGESLLVTIRYEPTALGVDTCTVDTGDSLCSDVSLVGLKALTDSLTVYWSFDTDFTATIGGPAFDGTQINGVTIDANGKFNGAASFDRANNEYISIGSQVITQGEDHTYSAWYRSNIADISGANRYFVLETKPNYSASYGLRDQGGDVGQVFTNLDPSGDRNVLVPGGAGTQWHNIIVTYDADNTGAEHVVYLDGVFVANMSSSSLLETTTGLNIGSYRFGSGRNFDGLIDDVAFWNRVLTPGEIATLQTQPVELPAFAVIDSINDVPGDQGGWARIHFTRSIYDDADEDSIPVATYGVHRRIDNVAFIAEILENGEPVPPKVTRWSNAGSDIEWIASAGGGERWIRMANTYYHASTNAMAPPGMWEVLGSVPAQQTDQYIYLAPTLADSADTLIYTTYYVSAHTTTPSIFFDSPPDSGYSVDNIAPGVPQGFLLTYNTGSGNQLVWDAAPEPDFQYHKVYRDTDPNFIHGPGNFVHATASQNWTDPDFDGWNVYYKITTVDDATNESDAAAPDQATGVPRSVIPKRFALYQNAPNPFNPTTVIDYDVPAGGGHVTLRIYDVSGRFVRTLVDKTQTPGEKRTTWNGTNDTGERVASGVYFYRFVTTNFVMTRKMVLLQ